MAITAATRITLLYLDVLQEQGIKLSQGTSRRSADSWTERSANKLSNKCGRGCMQCRGGLKIKRRLSINRRNPAIIRSVFIRAGRSICRRGLRLLQGTIMLKGLMRLAPYAAALFTLISTAHAEDGRRVFTGTLGKTPIVVGAQYHAARSK